jgi:hypothetical protein
MPLGCQSAYADDTGTDHKTPLDLLEQSCDVLMDITKGPTMALSPVQVSVLGIGAVVLLATPNINTPPPANTSALCATRPERCATSSRRTASIWSSARKYRFHERRGGGEGRTHRSFLSSSRTKCPNWAPSSRRRRIGRLTSSAMAFRLPVKPAFFRTAARTLMAAVSQKARPAVTSRVS